MTSIFRSIVHSSITKSVRLGSRVQQILSNTWSFRTNKSDMTFTRSSTQTFTDFEGLVKTVPNDVSAHVGARMVENLNSELDLGAWNTFTSGSGSITDNGDGTVTVTDPTSGDRAFIWREIGTLGVGDYRLTADFSDITVGDDGSVFEKQGGTATFTVSTTPRITDSQSKRFSVTVSVTVAGTVQLRAGVGSSASSAGSHTIGNLQVEEVTGQANQNPSEFVEGVKFFNYENGNTVDGNGVVTVGRGLPIPVTNEFSRHETNLLGASSWDSFAAPFVSGGATFSIDVDGRSATVTNPGGGRAFVGFTIDFVSGNTYCVSMRSDLLSGAAGTQDNIVAQITGGTGDKSLDISQDGLLQIVFTATTTESKFVRFGIGCSNSEPTASSFSFSLPVVRDVTGLANQNAPSETIDNTVALLDTNENTVSSNLVTEISGQPVGPVRSYDSVVIYGDSFTNDAPDVGSNLPGLAGVVFETKGVAGDRLDQIRAIMEADVPRSPVNAVLIEGGVNDIHQASVDPTAQMMIDQAAMVQHAVDNDLQYIVYTIGPWKTFSGWTAEKQGWTDTYNQWIRDTYDPRRVVDMYAVLEDPGTPDTLLAAYDSGDGLHPNAAGSLAVDTVTAPLLTPEWMKGVLLDTSPTELRRDWVSPGNGMSFQLKSTVNFNGSDAKGADHALMSLVFDSTNYLEVTVDSINGQMHLNRSVAGVVGTASTADLGYVAGDELNIRGVADNNGLRLWVDSVTASSTSAAAKADFTSAPTEIRINENAAGVTGVSIASTQYSIWNEAKPDSFLENLA